MKTSTNSQHLDLGLESLFNKQLSDYYGFWSSGNVKFLIKSLKIIEQLDSIKTPLFTSNVLASYTPPPGKFQEYLKLLPRLEQFIKQVTTGNQLTDQDFDAFKYEIDQKAAEITGTQLLDAAALAGGWITIRLMNKRGWNEHNVPIALKLCKPYIEFVLTIGQTKLDRFSDDVLPLLKWAFKRHCRILVNLLSGLIGTAQRAIKHDKTL